MTTITQEATDRSPVVCTGPRPVPVPPGRYAYDFADRADAPRIADLGGHHSLAAVRASLAAGDDEWIVARRGPTVVAAVCVRCGFPDGTHTIDAPAVAEEHRHCGLERYLTHLAQIWTQSIGRAAA